MSNREPVLLSQRETMALLNCGYDKFKKLLEAGIVPPGIGLGPRSMLWERDALIAHLTARNREQNSRAA
jgi:hypothetical protein